MKETAMAPNETSRTRVGLHVPHQMKDLPAGPIRDKIQASLDAYRDKTPEMRAQYERLMVGVALHDETHKKLARLANVSRANTGVILNAIERDLGGQILLEVAEELGVDPTLLETQDATTVVRCLERHVGREFFNRLLASFGVAYRDVIRLVKPSVILSYVRINFGRFTAESFAQELGMTVAELSDKEKWSPLWVFEQVMWRGVRVFGTVMAPINFARNFHHFSWGPADRMIKVLGVLLALIPGWAIINYAARPYLLMIPRMMGLFNKNKRAWVRFRTWWWGDPFVTIDTWLNPGVKPIKDDGWSMTLFVPHTYLQVPAIVAPCRPIFPKLDPIGLMPEGEREEDFIALRPVRPDDHFGLFQGWRETCPKIGQDLIDPHIEGNQFLVGGEIVMIRVLVEKVWRHRLKIRVVRDDDPPDVQRFDGWLATKTVPWGHDPLTGYPVNVITKGQVFCTHEVPTATWRGFRPQAFPLRCQFGYQYAPFQERAQNARRRLSESLRQSWHNLRTFPLRTLLALPKELAGYVWSFWEVQKAIRAELARIRDTSSELFKKLASDQPVLIETARKTEAQINLALATWASSYDVTGKYTKNHVINVQRDAMEVDSRLKRRYPHIQAIRSLDSVILGYAALVHDVGKGDVPDEILNATGEIPNEQKVYMGFHVILTIIRLGESLPNDANKTEIITIAGGHHLTWKQEAGGYGGYPGPTFGEDTHLGARILQPVDVTNAIMEERSYKPKRPPKIAIGILLKGCQTGQFDPLVGMETALMYMERYHLIEDPDLIRELTKVRAIPEANRWGEPVTT